MIKKDYYEKNKDIISNKAKEYDINNRDVLLNRSKEYYINNREINENVQGINISLYRRCKTKNERLSKRISNRISQKVL